MINKMKKKYEKFILITNIILAIFILISLIVLMFAASILLYSNMPDKIPMHWNSKGEIVDYSSKLS